MTTRNIVSGAVGVTAATVLLAAAAAAAHAPSAEVWIPAAARVGPWHTDLYLLNPGDAELTATLAWLERGRANPDPATVTVTVAAGESLPLVDVLASRFGLDRAEGALRVEATAPVVATSRIRAAAGGGTVGQGFDGVPASEVTPAGAATHVQGVAHDGAYRSNVYALGGAEGAVVEVEVVDATGAAVASGSLSLGPWEPYLERLPALVGPVAVREGALRVRVVAGAAAVGVSRVDLATDDPTTLAAWVEPRAPSGPATFHGLVVAAPGGAAGAVAVRLDRDGRVVGVELSYPSERCPVVFSAGLDRSAAPLPPDRLADGLRFTSRFDGGGEMAWLLRLAPDGAGALVGALEAAGSGFAGSAAECNGPHGPRDVRLGVR